MAIRDPSSRAPSRSPPPRRNVVAVSVDGRTVEVLIRRNAAAKRFILRVNRAGDGAVVTLPARASLTAARAFLARHADWLSGRLAPESVGEPALPTRLALRGRETDVVYSFEPRGRTRFADGDPPTLSVAGEAAHARRRLVDFLKRLAREDIDAAVARHAASLGVRPGPVTLRDPVSRWGSASRRGLSLSWRLVMAPPFVLDYVVAHEVAHLKEMNHSPRFWAVCRSLAPETEAARAWLKAHGGELHRAV